MRAAFIYTNPGHHVEMMAPVMRALVDRGHRCEAVSLAELRGLVTRPIDVVGVEPVRAIPARVRKSPAVGASAGVDGVGALGLARRLAQRATWMALAPRLLFLSRRADVVVVPNDAAFPYRELAGAMRWLGVPFVLMQEGIRFPLPGVAADQAYGNGGAAAVCAWGEASAEYFSGQGVPPATVRVTGSPRFDLVDVDAGRRAGADLRRRLGLARPPLALLSNPIDDQGFCSTAAKLELVRRFLDAAAPTLAGRETPVVIKLHGREDATGFRAAAAASRAADRTQVLEGEPLNTVLGAAGAAVVLASTVGIEALLFGLPLGVLSIPGHGHVFDYVQGGAAVGFDELSGGEADARIGEQVAVLLDGATTRTAGARYLDRQLAERGRAAMAVAAVIEQVGGARPGSRGPRSGVASGVAGPGPSPENT